MPQARRARGRTEHHIPTGRPAVDPAVSYAESEFGFDPYDPAAGHITRALARLKLLYDIDAREDPELLAKAIDKGRRDYAYEESQRKYYPREQPPEHVVYYVRIGKLIKIGTSRQLAIRLKAYPPDAVLLATEPGDRNLEKRRLRQFRATAATKQGEYFLPTAELVEHINSLRETPLTAADLQ